MEDNQPPKLKAGMKTWSSAVAAHTSGRYSDAIAIYDDISNISGRMYYNMACAYEKLGDIENAVKCLTNAVENDVYLAIAYFQRGSLFLLQKRTKEAVSDIEKARTLMRGNSHINYKPLGLLGCMYCYQVLHNLALAQMYEGNRTEAHELLVEALHDTDATQKMIINKTVESIQNGKVEDIKPLLVPTDRVFTPPKSITKNLVKKSLMQKAKVVSAADANDLSPTFDGIRRVEEIKQLPEKKDPWSATLGRFKKNARPRDRRASDVTDMITRRPMKSSKSMGDIFSFENATKEDVKLRDKNVLNLTIKQSASAINLDQKSQQKLSPDETKSPKSPLSPLRVVKKILKSKPARSRTSAQVYDGVEPVVLMRGCGSTGDLKHFEDSDEDPLMGSFASIRAASNKSIERDQTKPRDSRTPSLGTLFGNSLSVIGQTLSLSCDVLTAFATPTETGSDVTDVNQRKLSRTSDCSTSSGENNDDSAQFYIEHDFDRNTSLVTRIGFTTKHESRYETVTLEDDVTSDEISINNSENADDVTSGEISINNSENADDVTSRGEMSTGTSENLDNVTKRNSDTIRPPPPSYDPPPLPRVIVHEA